MGNKIICPFCGADITESRKWNQAIPQEETVKRDYSMTSRWSGSYITETKYKRNYRALCCTKCYDEHNSYEKKSSIYIKFSAPVCSIAAMIFFIVINEAGFWAYIYGTIIYGIIGLLLSALPLLVTNLIFGKRTSYKHAEKCNAVTR